MKLSRTDRRMLEKANSRWPEHLLEIDRKDWPNLHHSNRVRVLRSRHYLVQVFQERLPVLVRLTVCGTSVDGDRWTDGISWDVLQRLKREAGYGDMCAVEIFPPDGDVVNVANMRHLWVLAERPPFVWCKQQRG
jgi:hypothetical protein